MLLSLLLTVQADPTRPAQHWGSSSEAQQAHTVSQLQLQLIKQTENGPVAMINGQLLKPGDNYKTFRLLRIDTNKVLIQKENEQQVLYLLNMTIKNYD